MAFFIFFHVFADCGMEFPHACLIPRFLSLSLAFFAHLSIIHPPSLSAKPKSGLEGISFFTTRSSIPCAYNFSRRCFEVLSL